MQKNGQCYICGSEGVEYVTGNQKMKDLDFNTPNPLFLKMFDDGHICGECHYKSAEKQGGDKSLGIEKPFHDYVQARKMEFDKKRKDLRDSLKKYRSTFHC